MNKETFCADCLTDPEIVCKRDPDALCLLCGKQFCGGHIAGHLKAVHCIAVDNNRHARRRLPGKRR
jgi:hypothetical protein